MSDDFHDQCQIFLDCVIEPETHGRLYPVSPVGPYFCLRDGDMMRTLTRSVAPAPAPQGKPRVIGRHPRALVDFTPHPCPKCGIVYTPNPRHPRCTCNACQYKAKKAAAARKAAGIRDVELMEAA